MSDEQRRPPIMRGGGASSLRTTIIAGLCGDQGVSVMCVDCGHIFVESNPLSDESQPIDNVTLAYALYYHMCPIGRRPAKTGRRRER